MNYKILLLLLFSGLGGVAQCADSLVITDPVSAHLSPQQNLKAYALTVCYGAGFTADKALTEETIRAARFYIEKGKYQIEAYNEAANLARAFQRKNYLSEKGETWAAMKCVDLLYSKELAKLVKRYEDERIAITRKGQRKH
jgi:hypothetical protein